MSALLTAEAGRKAC